MMRRSFLIFMGAIAGVVLTIIATHPHVLLVGSSATAAASAAYQQLDLFAEVYERVRIDYVEKPDDAMLIDSAIRAVHGKIDDQAALRAALRKADFKSLRGSFKFNINNFPIQDYYIAEVVKRQDGEMEFGKIDLAIKDGKDSFYEECKMPTQ